jgi:hypothetical protein
MTPTRYLHRWFFRGLSIRPLQICGSYCIRSGVSAESRHVALAESGALGPIILRHPQFAAVEARLLPALLLLVPRIARITVRELP